MEHTDKNNINVENKYDMNITSTKKFTSTKWNMIEKPLSESEKKRNQIILKLGENITSSSNELDKNNIYMIGDYYYQIVKNDLLKIIDFSQSNNKNNSDQNTGNSNLDNETKTKKNTKKDKSKEKINSTTKAILTNILDTVNKKFEVLKKLLIEHPEDKIYLDLMNNLNFIEFRIIVLMKIIQHYTQLKKVEIGKIEELILGSKKILNLLKNIKTNKNNEYNNYFKKICNIENYDINLSNDMINDFENKINQLTVKYGIKLIDIANTRPKLIFDTKYDETIPNMKLKPYDSQIELANIVKTNISNGFLIFYKTLPGLGKTSMILSICSYIRKSDSILKVIFCCSDLLESVRVQVLRIMFNFGIKFGIASSYQKDDKFGDFQKDGKFTITNSWNCHKDDERELIVADYKSTYLLLKEAKNKYLLFFDEPTVLTDQVDNSITLNYLSQILYHIPSHIILSSATLPMLNELDPIQHHYKMKYQDGIIKEIISNKTLIGCVIKDFNSNIIVPHSNCVNQNDLKEIIKKIKNFPLLGKFYTLPFLINLNNFCYKYNMSINLDSIESFEQDNVLEYILFLLERISNTDSKELFNDFINIKINDIQDDTFDSLRLDIEYNKIVPNKFLTSHAFKYLGCCLIATSNPLEYSKNNLYQTIEKLKEKVKIDNVNTNYEKFLSDMSKYNENVEKIKAKHNFGSKIKIANKSEIDDKNKLSQEEQIDEEVARLKIPKFEFDIRLEINTEPHITSFAKYVKSFDSSMAKRSICHEKINITHFNIDDNLKFLLYMGVGLYSKDLDPDYIIKVLEMLQDGELAYIIADESFCYGANYLITNVIINDDIGNSHSINTILQLIGRTARVGKSWSGKVYLDLNTSERIKQFFLNPSFTSIEGININTFFNNIKNQYEQEIIDKNNQVKQEQVKQEQLKQEQEQLKQYEYIKDKNLNSNNTYDNIENDKNEIYTWKRGMAFKTQKSTNDVKNNNSIWKCSINDTKIDKTTLDNDKNDISVWKRGMNFKKSEEIESKIKNDKNELNDRKTIIRGINASSNLFVPKSLNDLKKSNNESILNNNFLKTNIEQSKNENPFKKK